MVSNSSFRKSFIDSSIRTARLYGFHGLDFCWVYANSSSDMYSIGVLFQEWRAAINLEALNSSYAQLILTAAVIFKPGLDSGRFPLEAMERYLDWAIILAYDYYTPQWYNFTSAQAALHDPSSNVNTDYGIRAWISRGLSADKMVLGLPFYGYARTLANPMENGIGAPATGPAITESGAINCKDIRNFAETYGANVMYNTTYVVNYCTVGTTWNFAVNYCTMETTWIGFDDVDVAKTKVAYAMEKLLGYIMRDVAYDDNWILSQAAAQESNKNGGKKWRLLATVLSRTAAAILLLGCFLIYYFWQRELKSKGSKKKINDPSATRDFNRNAHNLITYSFREIEAATGRFSFENKLGENKLGEGGYGPVYKALLPNGQEVAVKKLSKTSTQGYEEFRNEVMLTAKLQHANLVRILGFYPMRRYILDQRKHVQIIEGITQGLLYLQEYSRFTIIHRDLKATNVLLDEGMKPKISDFGMARIFTKDEFETNTSKVVGTHGFVPPEYVKRGIHSTKLDVYSFGVLLQQIISGNKVSALYGPEENLSLLDHAYKLWKEVKGMVFMDPSLDDKNSSYIMSLKKPAFSKQAGEDRETIVTFNDITISEVVGGNALSCNCDDKCVVYPQKVAEALKQDALTAVAYPRILAG
ncbi:G-type lectin S-receptor-like serine/threonine-protein kinase At1g61550 [Mangifera indica]|uniref:G-type lectin S-receptor-like serine/threonine-protein kinase At1g61550 n=1 Tax=Mangifera indica TaxID=29780 RepID=UPI001CFBDBE1|nr:G-type lectin S-receptor-like serine/threonine-protein kinase At1g61550 [Mangifera indica]